MKITAIALLCIVCVFGACQGRSEPSVNLLTTPLPSTTPEPDSTKPAIPEALLRASPDELCAKLKDIKTLPTFHPTPTDPIYEALIAKGDAAVPCLVAKISDKTPMPDPRYSVPQWQHFAVGDTAVFTLLDILRENDLEREKLLIEMLSPKYKKEWETNGIYAYFNYVSEPKNRLELQRWWSNLA